MVNLIIISGFRVIFQTVYMKTIQFGGNNSQRILFIHFSPKIKNIK